MQDLIQCTAARDDFRQWLVWGHAPMTVYKGEKAVAMITRLEKSPSVEYLYQTAMERGSVSWNNDLTFCGVSDLKNNTLYLTKGILDCLADGQAPLVTEAGPSMVERITSRINQQVEDAIANDQSRLPVQELTDWQALRDIQSHMTKASPTPQLHVAAYCRIAGGEEQNTVLESQRVCYTKQIGANPDRIMAGIFADIGDSRSKHPEFQKMLRKCRQKKIDLILVKSVSRFARNMADCLSTMRELRELGVAVIFEQENISTADPDFDALTSLMAEFARAECEHLTKNSIHTHYMAPISRPAKKTWKKMIRLPGRPEKTIIFRME